jgi:hypothetical protein
MCVAAGVRAADYYAYAHAVAPARYGAGWCALMAMLHPGLCARTVAPALWSLPAPSARRSCACECVASVRPLVGVRVRCARRRVRPRPGRVRPVLLRVGSVSAGGAVAPCDRFHTFCPDLECATR